MVIGTSLIQSIIRFFREMPGMFTLHADIPMPRRSYITTKRGALVDTVKIVDGRVRHAVDSCFVDAIHTGMTPGTLPFIDHDRDSIVVKRAGK